MDAIAKRDLYDIGELPQLGHVPRYMHAWVIRPDRQGDPELALRAEIVEVPDIGSEEALVLVMAAGVNYNGVWACLGKPVPVFDLHGHDLHIPGSDAAGIVWAIGSNVSTFKVGDEVVVHCHQDDGQDEECNGGDPMNSPTQRIWGYETPFGSFAQFTKVQARQLIRRPGHLSWEASGSYMLTLATAYRMLFGHPPNVVKPGSNVLIWGAAGGLGAMAVQLVVAAGGNAVGIVGDDVRAGFAMALGARGTLNRNSFACWGGGASIGSDSGYPTYLAEARRFGRAIRQLTAGEDVDIVFEHPGADTFPVSCLVCKRGGMVVFCASTTGYALTFDSRFVWTRQKRIQGSHFANQKQASEANRLIRAGRIQPALGQTFEWWQVPLAHVLMMRNRHAPGNHVVRIGASVT
jgi:crotonyl-CoA carboxylase/reductase